MDTKIIENLNKAGKTTFGSIKALYEINIGIMDQLAEQQMALMNLGIEYSTRQLKTASEANGYKELVNSQSEITVEIYNKAQGIVRNTVDILNETKDEVNAWIDKGMNEAEKSMNEVSKTVSSKKKAA